MSAYCFALEKEILREGQNHRGATVGTVFFGGGTPSIVPTQAMRGVLDALHSSFAIAPDAEFTVEANPGTLRHDWLDVMCAGGMNRLSLGVQAAQDELLARIGRIHTFAQAREAVAMARSHGIRNINLDVMSGLPGQTVAQHLDTLKQVCELQPQHISAYSLILEEGTPLHAAVRSGSMSLPDEDATVAMYEEGAAFLEAAGYPRYEVSNFSMPGYACRHNIGYWQGAWYLGLGVAAHSMLPPDAAQASQGAVRMRRANTEDLAAYLSGCAEPEWQAVDHEEAMFETMMLGLRMVDGVSEADFLRRHGVRMEERYGARLEGLVRDGLGAWHGEGGLRRFALTPRGIEVQNEALIRLMD